jgi:hypothetical protein
MRGRYTLSVALLISSILLIYTTKKFVKRGWVKWSIRIPVLLVYLPFSFLVLIRSTCESNYWGALEDEAIGSAPAIMGNADSGACKQGSCAGQQDIGSSLDIGHLEI